MAKRYLDLLVTNEDMIAKNVTENLYDRHIAPVFLSDDGMPHPSGESAMAMQKQ